MDTGVNFTLCFWFFIIRSKNSIFGFFVNPIDGLSYLAKINQGANGEWLFHLPYSSGTHLKVFLFSFYILIGKISSLVFGDLRIGFHFFRLLSSFFFYHQLMLFVDEYFDKGLISRYLKIGVLFGGGLGWLYLISGDIPADFWIAEAFPFLSAFVNPHFILSLGLIVFLLRYANSDTLSMSKKIRLGLAAFILANISPFAVVIGGIILIAGNVWDYCKKKQPQFSSLVIYVGLAAPIMIYQFWIVRTIDPLISWNAQNITTAPLVPNFVFSFSPFFVTNFALLGLFIIKKIPLNKLQFVLSSWMILAMIFVYLPLDLQRRFMVGYYLAAIVLFFSFINSFRNNHLLSCNKTKRMLLIFMILIFPSNLILFFGAGSAVIQKNENLFIQTGLVQIYEWLNDFGIQEGVVLTEETEGLSLPAFTNQRVVVGHPFETPFYEKTLDQVNTFFDGSLSELPDQFYRQFNINYILINKTKMDKLKSYFKSMFPVFENENYLLFQVNK